MWLINQCSSTITSTGVMAQMSNVNHFQLKSGSSVMTLITKCQSPTIKVKYKCDDLVNQSSVNHQQWSLSIVSWIVLYQSTINPQVGLNCTKKTESQLFQRTSTMLELPGLVSSPTTFSNHATLDASQWCIRCKGELHGHYANTTIGW